MKELILYKNRGDSHLNLYGLTRKNNGSILNLSYDKEELTGRSFNDVYTLEDTGNGYIFFDHIDGGHSIHIDYAQVEALLILFGIAGEKVDYKIFKESK